MILPHAVLLFSVFLPALTAPDLTQARTKVNEIRARSLANRARLRSNAARITEQLESVRSSRPKRQQYPQYPLPPPPPYQNTQYEDPEPVLVHICSVEDDGYARSAEEHDDLHLDHSVPKSRKRKPPTGQDKSGRGAEMFVEDVQDNPLDLQELTDVREIMHRFEDDNLRHSDVGLEQRPNSKFLKKDFEQVQSDLHAEKQPRILTTDRGDIVEAGRVNSAQGQDEKSDENARDAEAAADPHLHIHNHGRRPIVTPGFHLAHHALHHIPVTSVVTPGLNLNINQNQAIHSGLRPVLPLGHNRPLNTHTLPSITQVVPLEDSVVSNQAQSFHISRFSGKDAEAESLPGHGHHPGHFPPPHHGPPVHHRPHPHHFQHGKINKPHHNNHGRIRESEDDLVQNSESFIDDGIALAQMRDNEERAAISNPDPVRIQFQPEPEEVPEQIFPNHPDRPNSETNFWETQTNTPSESDISNDIDHFRHADHRESLREAEENFDQNEEIHEEEDENLSSLERVASPTFKKKKMKKMKFIPIYLDQYPTYSSYYDNGYYREAETDPDLEDSDDKHEDEPSSVEREADPTLKKKKQKEVKLIPVYYQQYPTYGSHYDNGPYRDAEVDPVFKGSDDEDDFLILDREANPTHKKLKKKIQSFPTYVPQSYSPYRDTEESGDDIIAEDFSENRDADATHKKKHKHKWPPRKLVEDGEIPEESGQTLEDFSHNREVEDGSEFVDAPSENFSDAKDAEATHKKKRKHKFPHRSAEDPEGLRQGDEGPLDDLISSNFLFNFPARRRFNDQFKRSLNKDLVDLLGKNRQIVDNLERQSQNDEDLKFVTDLSNRTLTDLEEKVKKITKRSIPLARLISDPNVRLDVPQTLENFGTATKNAVEDERAPMYHLKQMLGSSKNALLSAMRIPPQNMIIPSDYEIVRSSQLDPSMESVEDEDQDDHFSHTFRKVGQMVRQSIKSSQEAAAHLGDVAHSARNVLNTARHAAPRLIIPYSQIPAIQNPKALRPNKAVLITPRILDLSEATSHSARNAIESRPNFVRFGHLTDAVGISKPHSKNLDLQKIIFEPRRISEAKVDERLAQLYDKIRNNHRDDVDTVGEALSTLEDAKVSVGAQNLRDFLVKMKHELSDMVSSNPHKHKKVRLGTKKQQEGKEMGKFIETLFDNEHPKNGESPEDPKRQKKKKGEVTEDEVVGDSLFLPPELMHPFMGRPSEIELQNFLKDNGDEQVDYTSKRQKNQEVSKTNTDDLNGVHRSDLGSVLGAINPLMFERLYNQTVRVNDNELSSPQDMFQRHHFETHEDSSDEGNGTVASSFGLTGNLKKPFMGQVSPERIEDFLDTYNLAGPDYIDLDE